MSATAAAPAPAAAASASAALPPTAPASAANAAASSTPLGSSAQTFADDSSSLSAFLLSGLPALYKHSSRKHEALRQACVEVISKIKAEDKYRQDKAAKGIVVPPDSDANKYFLPLKLACDTGQAKLVALALDTMEKLIAYGYLDGNAPVTEEMYPSKKKEGTTGTAATAQPTAAAPATAASADPSAASSSSAPAAPAAAAAAASDSSKRRLIHVMLETLYECSMYSDSLVQRQVIKALLTTVSSVSCPVHDHGLLQAVTSLYQIYLQAGDETNRTTSRAALTQIFNLVFQRMEMFAEQLKKLDEAAKQQREADKAQSLQNNEGIPTASPSPSPTHGETNGDSAGSASNANPDATQDSTASSTVTDGADSSVVGSGSLDLDTSAVEAHAVEPALGGADESDGAEFGVPTPTGAVGSQSRSSPSLTPRSAPGKRGFCVVCGKPANHSCLQTRDSVCGMECKLINLSKKDPNRKQALSVRARIANKLQTLQNDAYYLLRALIKLSHKALLTSPPEQAAVDSKLLSLTLLLSVMSSAGPTFQSNKNFIALVKTDLVNCLLRNSAASQIDAIFSISSSIFVAMLKGFKPHLHRSIGPMLDSIYLPYIQSPNSSFEHKATSLQVLRSICSDHQLLVDLFLNYDCDLGSFNTFQKIAEVLEKTSQAKTMATEEEIHSAVVSEETSLTGEQEMRIKSIALEALVGAMNSLAVWTTRIVKPIGNAMAEQVEHATHGNAGADGNISGGELMPVGAGRSTALAAIGAAAAAAAMTSGADDDNTSATSASRKGTLQVDDPCPSPPSSSPNPPNGSAGSSLSTGAAMASSFSTTFHSLRLAKQKFDTGISKFNAKPKVGLAYLQQHGLLGETPEDIARFFHANPTLDKVQLGDYMGDEHAFNKSVLYAYVDMMDFTCMSFDESIRAFVQGFRLPGEAQKIDRMMEKFAERYHKNNPGRFASADTAYVLAYSIIMLNTDAHNPGVKVRMTVDDFRKNTRGIDDGKDLDPAFMAEIYERITKNEIIMKNDPLSEGGAAAKKQAAAASASNPKKRFHAFVKESQQMVRRTQELIKTTSNPKTGAAAVDANGAAAASAAAAKSLSRKEKQYLDEISSDRLDQPENAAPTPSAAAGGATSSSATSSGASNGSSGSSEDSDRKHGEKVFYEATDADAEAIRPMFEILSFPSLATFSLHLESTTGESAASMEIVRLCLQGYKSAIQVANALEMQTSRLAFISSLKQFTYLGSGKQMRRKNIEAICALLSLGATPASGNHLKQSWFEVLQVISEVERLHLIANNNLRGREMDFRQELVSGTAGSTGMGLPSSGRTLSISAPPSMSMGGVKSETETLNSLQVHLIDPSMIDRVFACSAHLDGEAIVDFVQALRAVSEQELSSLQAPRVFSLQKMVEITYFNMNRIRVVWNRIWSLLSEYFQRAGCHAHLNVSMYAIDSLRQLATKFLEKDELASYQFQRHFFKPFEFIMLHTQSMEIRELVLQCIDRMIQAKVKNIRSGWLGVLQVLTVAANAASTAAAISGPGTLAPLTASGGKHHSVPASPISLLTLAFSILSHIMTNYFQLVAETGLETMDECVNCLVTFGCNQFSQSISSAAIQFLVECASSLNKEKEPATPQAAAANGDATPQARKDSLQRKDSAGGTPATPRLNSLPSASSSGQVSLKVWFLVLTGLSRMVSDPRVEVRSLALSTLFQILNTHGHVFSQATWRAVFHGVLLPLFDDVRSANEAAHHSKHDAPGRNSNASSGSSSPEMSRRVSREPDAMTTAPNFARAASVANSPSHAAHSLVTPPGPNANALGHRPTSSTGSPADARRRSMITPPSSAAVASAHFDNSWLQTTCYTALSSLVELFARFHSSVHFLLPELLRLLNGCIGQAHAEPLAKIGVRCLVVLLHKIGAELSVGDWWIVLKSCEESLQSVIPQTLLSAKLRAHLMLPPAASPPVPIYTSLVRPVTASPESREDASASPESATSPDSATTASPSRTVSSTTDDAAVTSARSSPLSPHQRSVSAHIPAAVSVAVTTTAGASGGAPVPPSLPFHLGAMLTRLKVQLWLSEAIFQSVMRFFPKIDMVVKGKREEATLNDEEQTGAASAADAASSSAAAAASSSASVPLVNPSDRRVVGCLLPSQALYAVDLLGDVLNFTHAFNADINLRRKLHSAGFFIPPHSTSSAQQQPQQNAATGASVSTVPPSPAPVPLTGAAANGGFPLLSSPSPAPLHSSSQPSQAPASAPKRLPQLFYNEAHTMRLAMDVLFRLITESQAHSDEAAATTATDAAHTGATSESAAPATLSIVVPSELWSSELRLPSASSSSSSSTDLLSVSESRLMSLCSLVLRDYVSKTQSGQLVSLEFSDEILVGLVHNFASAPRQLFRRYLGQFFLPLTELIEYAAAPTIRQAIRKLFAESIGPILVQQGIDVVQSPNSAR